MADNAQSWWRHGRGDDCCLWKIHVRFLSGRRSRLEARGSWQCTTSHRLSRPVKERLHRLGLTSDSSWDCPLDEGGGSETPDHFLNECTKYIRIRDLSSWREWLGLTAGFLDTAKSYKDLAAYVVRMMWLKLEEESRHRQQYLQVHNNYDINELCGLQLSREPLRSTRLLKLTSRW